MKEQRNDKRLDELISQTIESGKLEFDAEKWKQKYPEEFELLKSRAGWGSTRRDNLWRTIMNYRTTKLAAAAVIIIAVLIGIQQFGGSIDGASVAWAEVAKKIEQMPPHIIRAKIVATCEGKETPFLELDIVEYTSPEYGVREDFYDQYGNLANRVYILTSEKISIMVAPVLKEFKVAELDESQLRVLQMSIEQIIQQLESGQYTELGRKTIDGIEAEGIEISDAMFLVGAHPIKFDSIVIRIWVDVKTSVPVLMEGEIVITSDKFATVWTGGKPLKVEVVADEIQWDVELDKSIFEPNIPDDYTLIADETDSYNEGKAVLGLQTFTELTGGKYPGNLDMMTVLQEGFSVIQEYINEAPEHQADEKGIEKMRKMMLSAKPSCLFYAELVRQDKDTAYYGDTVTAEDVDAVLMRWKVSDDEYRVIFGDLTTENITAEQLAELEKISSE